jgi:hypothetical protein
MYIFRNKVSHIVSLIYQKYLIQNPEFIGFAENMCYFAIPRLSCLSNSFMSFRSFCLQLSKKFSPQITWNNNSCSCPFIIFCQTHLICSYLPFTNDFNVCIRLNILIAKIIFSRSFYFQIQCLLYFKHYV